MKHRCVHLWSYDLTCEAQSAMAGRGFHFHRKNLFLNTLLCYASDQKKKKVVFIHIGTKWVDS